MMALGIRQLLLISLSFSLLACGGGGGGGSSEGNPASDNVSSTSDAPSSSNSSRDSDSPQNSASRSVSISWDAPTAREDGSPLTLADLSGYEIYFFLDGTAEDEGTVITIDDPAATKYTTELLSGTYYFSISSIDANGLYSDLSDYLSVIIP